MSSPSFRRRIDSVNGLIGKKLGNRISIGINGGAHSWQEALNYIATLPQWEEVFTTRMAELTASKTSGSTYVTLSANINAVDITKIATSNMFVSVGTESNLNQRKWYPIQWMDTLNTRLILKITAKETLATSTVKIARPIIRTLKNIDPDNADDASIVTDSLCIRLTGQDAFNGQIEIDINSGIIELDNFRTARDGASVLDTPATSAYTSPVYLQRIYNMNHERGEGFDGPFLKHAAGLIIKDSRFSGENHVLTFANNVKDFIEGHNLTIESRNGSASVSAEPTSQAICAGKASYTGSTFICLSHKSKAEFIFQGSGVDGSTEETGIFNNGNFLVKPIGDSAALSDISLIKVAAPLGVTVNVRLHGCTWDVDPSITATNKYLIYALLTGTVNLTITNASVPPGYSFLIGGGTFNLTWVNNGLNQDVAYAASITPNPHYGEIINIGEMTGDITMNAPVNPIKGQRMTVNGLQDSTGGRSFTWNAIYKKAADGAGTSDQEASTTFVYNGASWIQQGGALTWL